MTGRIRRARLCEIRSRFGIVRMRPLIALWFIATLAGCGGTSDATSSPSPVVGSISALARNQLVFDSDRGGNHEIYVMRTDGNAVVQLTNDGNF